jgi:hypothetical protein
MTRYVTSPPRTYSVCASILWLRDVTIVHGSRQAAYCWTSSRSHCQNMIRFMNLQNRDVVLEFAVNTGLMSFQSHELVFEFANSLSSLCTFTDLVRLACWVYLAFEFARWLTSWSLNLQSHYLVFELEKSKSGWRSFEVMIWFLKFQIRDLVFEFLRLLAGLCLFQVPI